MTDAQQDKMKEVSRILTEHFNGFVLVVASQNEAESLETYDMAMIGGTAKCLGMLNVGQSHLYKLLHTHPF